MDSVGLLLPGLPWLPWSLQSFIPSFPLAWSGLFRSPWECTPPAGLHTPLSAWGP